MRLSLFALGLAVVVFERSAWAEATDPAAAEQLFMAGRAAMESGDLEKACERFAESERLDPAAGTLINLADCLDRRGKIASAWQRWKEALDMLRTDDERRKAVTARAAAIEARVPKLEIRLAAGAPPNAVVERDDVVLGAASIGLSLPIDPGAHRIVVKASGHEPRAFAIEIREGESSTLEVDVGTVSATPPTEKPPAPVVTASASSTGATSSSAKRTWGFVGLGVGAAGLIVGGTAGVLAISKKNTVDDDCYRDAAGAHVCRTQAGVDAVDAGSTLATIANVGVAVGLVGVAAGTYLLLSSGSSSSTAAFVRPSPFGATAGVAHAF